MLVSVCVFVCDGGSGCHHEMFGLRNAQCVTLACLEHHATGHAHSRCGWRPEATGLRRTVYPKACCIVRLDLFVTGHVLLGPQVLLVPVRVGECVSGVGDGGAVVCLPERLDLSHA